MNQKEAPAFASWRKPKSSWEGPGSRKVDLWVSGFKKLPMWRAIVRIQILRKFRRKVVCAFLESDTGSKKERFENCFFIQEKTFVIGHHWIPLGFVIFVEYDYFSLPPNLFVLAPLVEAGHSQAWSGPPPRLQAPPARFHHSEHHATGLPPREPCRARAPSARAPPPRAPAPWESEALPLALPPWALGSTSHDPSDPSPQSFWKTSF